MVLVQQKQGEKTERPARDAEERDGASGGTTLLSGLVAVRKNLIERTIEHTGSPDPLKRAMSLQLLSMLLGAGAEEIMKGRLADPDPQVRERAVVELGRLRKPELYTTLLPLVSDRNGRVSYAAALALYLLPLTEECVRQVNQAREGAVRAFDPEVALDSSTAQDNRRRTAAEVLTNGTQCAGENACSNQVHRILDAVTTAPDPVAPLLEYARSSDELLSIPAIRTLAELTTPSANKALLELLHDSNLEIRRRTMASLGSAKRYDFLKPLSAIFHETKTVEDRRAVFAALADLRDSSSLPIIMQGLRSPDHILRFHAGRALIYTPEGTHALDSALGNTELQFNVLEVLLREKNIDVNSYPRLRPTLSRLLTRWDALGDNERQKLTSAVAAFGGSNHLALLARRLSSEEGVAFVPDAVAVATRNRSSSAEVLLAALARLPNVSAEDRALAVTSLGDRDSRFAERTLTGFLNSPDSEIAEAASISLRSLRERRVDMLQRFCHARARGIGHELLQEGYGDNILKTFELAGSFRYVGDSPHDVALAGVMVRRFAALAHLPSLRRLTSHIDPVVRSLAAETVTRIPGRGILRHLNALVDLSPHPEVRMAAARGLIQFGRKFGDHRECVDRGLKVLQEDALSKNIDTRQAVAREYGFLPERRSAVALLNMWCLEDSPQVRKEIHRSIDRIREVLSPNQDIGTFLLQVAQSPVGIQNELVREVIPLFERSNRQAILPLLFPRLDLPDVLTATERFKGLGRTTRRQLLVLDSPADWNRSNHLVATAILSFARKHDMDVVWASTAEDLGGSNILHLGRRGGQKFAAILYSAHSLQTNTALGTQDSRLPPGFEDERRNLNMSDATKLRNPDGSSFSDLLEPTGTVILVACYTGRGRVTEANIQNTVIDSMFPEESILKFGPTIATNLESLEMEGGRIVPRYILGRDAVYRIGKAD